MARIWSKRQLERTIPPQARDIRGEAFLAAVNRMLGNRPLPGPQMRDPEICLAEVLPALVAEWSMEEFIDHSWPEHVQRRVLANRWRLQSLEGTDAGVRLGLSLLGMRMLIKHWHQEEPMGPPNTHTITFLVGEALFDEEAIIGPRIIAAAHRMIDATKRWSQDSAIRIGANVEGSLAIGSAASSLSVSRGQCTAGRPTAFERQLGMASAAAPVTVVRPVGEARRPTDFKAGLGAVAGVRVLQINRISAKAA